MPEQSGFDAGRAWRLHPSVGLRPERFGALVYHYGNRRLAFLNDATLTRAVRGLADAPDARTALRSAGVAEDRLPAYEIALSRLAASEVICER